MKRSWSITYVEKKAPGHLRQKWLQNKAFQLWKKTDVYWTCEHQCQKYVFFPQWSKIEPINDNPGLEEKLLALPGTRWIDAHEYEQVANKLNESLKSVLGVAKYLGTKAELINVFGRGFDCAVGFYRNPKE